MSEPRRRSHATVFLAIASTVSLAILLVGTALPGLETLPTARWRAGAERSAIEQYAELATGTPLWLEVDLPAPAHVYVVSWSRLQGTIALFPSQRLQTLAENPLAAGTHALPGAVRKDGPALAWPIHDVVGPIHYFVLASKEPLTELEGVLATVRQLGQMGRGGAGGFADDGLYLFAPAGGMKNMPGNEEPAAPDLRTLFARPLDDMNGDGSLRRLAPGREVWGRMLVLQGR